MHVHRGRFLVQKAVFSTLSKGYIPETRARARVRVCVRVLFQNIINIYFYINPIRYTILSDIQPLFSITRA